MDYVHLPPHGAIRVQRVDEGSDGAHPQRTEGHRVGHIELEAPRNVCCDGGILAGKGVAWTGKTRETMIPFTFASCNEPRLYLMNLKAAAAAFPT